MMLPGDPEDYEDDDIPDFPLGPVLLLGAVFTLGVLMEYFNWTPFW